MRSFTPSLSYGQMAMTHVASTLRIGLRDRSVIWLAALFTLMVLLSAYLGWSATHAINQIYAQAILVFQADGRPIPPNPVADMPPLAMLRNMTTYVSLLGALVAIVLGVQMVAEDRRSGCYPLIASRPAPRSLYALSKVSALFVAVGCLLLLAAGVNAATILLLPGAPLTATDWMTLFQFYGVSALFLMAFGLMGVASAAWFRSETMGLLVPIAIWLGLTFVFPQLTANINPMAAMNPIKAMVAPPTAAFFQITGPILAPISLTSTYRDIAASLLGFAPVDTASLGITGGMVSLVLADLLLVIASLAALTRLDPTRSDFDE